MSLKNILIALDAGHGINTPGKRTPPIPELDGRVIREIEFNLPTVEKLDKILQRCGVRTMRTSDPAGKRDTPLHERSGAANKAKADLFVSIHYNASKRGIWGNHGGVEVHHHDRSLKGKKFASLVQKELVSATKLRDRGIKYENFHVTRITTMPALIVECGFMDNKKEALLMLDEKHQMNCATAVAKGICAYLGIKFVDEGEILKPSATVQQTKPKIIPLAKASAQKTKSTWEKYIQDPIVKDLQEALNKQFLSGLIVDGCFGDKTIAALPIIRQGAKGSLVRIIQTRLMAKGFSVGKCGVDGDFGRDTFTAIRKLQKDKKLLVDGVAGRETWKELFRK